MRVAIIGAGFSGLSAGYYLSKKGIEVTIYESGDKPGGLAIGFRQPQWDWTMESHYHHWFTNDWAIRNLAKEVGHKVLVVRPKTSTYIEGNIYQLDSPVSLLRFKKLSVIDRLRTGAVLAYLKFTPFWKSLEKITAKSFILKTLGKNSWNVLWGPLFEGKFQKYAPTIPAIWFWARIRKRTPSLAYPEGGFLKFAQKIDSEIRKNEGIIKYNNSVDNIKKENDKFVISIGKSKEKFDRVIVTLPTALFTKITVGLPTKYLQSLVNLKAIGAANLLVSLKHQFLTDGTYWLNINDRKMPYLAVVEHTNFMDKRNYNNENLVYIGNYLPHEHRYFSQDANTLLKEFAPHLKKVNKDFRLSWVNQAFLFKAFYAQPIIPLNYSERVPGFKTPIEGLFLCNIQQVYPWDRGTNYAVENGKIVAEMILKEKNEKN